MFCDNLEEWAGERSRGEVYEGEDIRMPVADSCSCMTETVTKL